MFKLWGESLKEEFEPLQNKPFRRTDRQCSFNGFLSTFKLKNKYWIHFEKFVFWKDLDFCLIILCYRKRKISNLFVKLEKGTGQLFWRGIVGGGQLWRVRLCSFCSSCCGASLEMMSTALLSASLPAVPHIAGHGGSAASDRFAVVLTNNGDGKYSLYS